MDGSKMSGNFNQELSCLPVASRPGKNISRAQRHLALRPRIVGQASLSEERCVAQSPSRPSLAEVAGNRWLRHRRFASFADPSPRAQPLPFAWARDEGRRLPLRSSLAPDLNAVGGTIGREVPHGPVGTRQDLTAARRISFRTTVVEASFRASSKASKG
jgi:hypothetical protein